jgi:serine/threonine protein phosphatase PrpC
MRAALADAEAAVRAVAWSPGAPEDPPETTVVAALRRGARLSVGWLRDSRAYLVGEGEARLLTHDHSWVNDVVEADAMTLAEALKVVEVVDANQGTVRLMRAVAKEDEFALDTRSTKTARVPRGP